MYYICNHWFFLYIFFSFLPPVLAIRRFFLVLFENVKYMLKYNYMLFYVLSLIKKIRDYEKTKRHPKNRYLFG